MNAILISVSGTSMNGRSRTAQFNSPVRKCSRTRKSILNYGGAQGSPNLIASLRRFHIANRIGGITEQALNSRDIVIGANGATSLLESITHLLPAGIIFTADPMYYIYCNDLERKGFKVVAIPEDAEGLDTELLKAKLTALGDESTAIRFFYIVTVNNPTCTILSNNRKRELVNIVTRLSYEVGRKIPSFLTTPIATSYMTAPSNLWHLRYATTHSALFMKSARCQRFLPQGCVSATS